jgi:hypothetical protein
MDHEDGGYYSANPSIISLNEQKENSSDAGHVGMPHSSQEPSVPSTFPHEVYHLGPGIQVMEEAQPGPSSHLPVDIQTGFNIQLQPPEAQITMSQEQTGPITLPPEFSQPTHQQQDYIHPDNQIMNPEDPDEVDRAEVDSAYDGASLLGDDTRSLASYITDYRYEHGRRYHAYRDGAYWVILWVPSSIDLADFASGAE